MTEKTKTKKYTVYIAKDGQEFPTKKSCLIHEWMLEQKLVYIVSARGQRSDEIELFSTRELAEERITDNGLYVIKEAYIDMATFVNGLV